MNFLILTPDGVGSTMLQRHITMALALENVTVMNTHELTNGLEIKNDVAVHKDISSYEQTLRTIIDIIKSSDKNTTLVSRLAKYHMDARNDSKKDSEDFYEFVNSHYSKKIMCVRENIFEYAMSWSIRQKSGVLNVYKKEDRQKVLNVTDVDEDFFVKKCQHYVDYHSWITTHFPDVQTISYENMVKDSDRILADLLGYENTYEKYFGMCLSSLVLNEYEWLRSLDKKQTKDLTQLEKKAVAKYRVKGYTFSKIDKTIVEGVPIKNTTLADKKLQIKNFDNCLNKFYKFAKNHNWIDQSKATYDFWNNTEIHA